MEFYTYKDMQLSAFCMGCAQFGQKYGIANKKNVEDDEAVEIINKAVEAGVNFFDTAADYGESETVLGRTLSLAKKDITIATKIKYVKGDISKGTIGKNIRNSVESSLKKLRRDHLDVVYIHQSELFFKFPDEFLKLLVEYKRKGLIGYIGISLDNPHEVDKALKYGELEIFQVISNALNRSFEESGKIDQLEKRGKLVAIRSVFLQGLLLMDPDALPVFFDPIKDNLKNFYEIIAANYDSRERFFLEYVLKKNFGPVILGISSTLQLEKNLGVFNDYFDNVKKGSRDAEIEIPKLNDKYIYPWNWS